VTKAEGNSIAVGELVVCISCPPELGNMADTPRVGLCVEVVGGATLDFCWLVAIHLRKRLERSVIILKPISNIMYIKHYLQLMRGQ